jgi:thiol-disulfide isomerase/thioredoxin/uncharacterized membrane protein YphA (DoxX/SURF4 family)
MDVILLLIRIFLFGILALAGIGKLVDFEGSKKAVKEFGVPEELADGMAISLPIAEIVFALMLLPLTTAWFGAIGTFLLLAIFIGGMIWQLAKGNAPDCHCFGAIHSEPVSTKSLIRNVVFALLAFFLILQGSDNQGVGLTDLDNEMAIQLFIGLATIGLLGAVVFYLKKISEQQTQIMRRIEVLELISSDGKKVERENVGTLREHLPIGSLIPEFELEDLNGKTVPSKKLFGTGKPALLFFVSPSCNPCDALLPEIEQWQEELKHKVDFIYVSSGKAVENVAKFGGKNFKRILLQKEREVGELFKASWTPAAIFINFKGVVGSHPAVGDEEIRELIGKIKAEQPEKLFAFAEKEGENGNGSKIGQSIPEFSLKDLQGREITSKDLQGKTTLITFWSMNCGFCLQMIDDLRNWEQEKGADAPNLLVFSRNKAEEHKDLTLDSPILLDDEHKISQKFGMDGTPSAVLVNENGKIVSELAIGAPNIWALLGKKQS